MKERPVQEWTIKMKWTGREQRREKVRRESEKTAIREGAKVGRLKREESHIFLSFNITLRSCCPPSHNTFLHFCREFDDFNHWVVFSGLTEKRKEKTSNRER